MIGRSIALTTALISLFAANAVSAQESCKQINTQDLPTIDEQRVRDAWLGWYNEYRSSLNLTPYVIDETLNATAGNWSFYSVKRGTIDHRRVWQGAYYDYKLIGKWFAGFGVTFPNVSGTTYTENIGWNRFVCGEDDCTDEMISATRSTFDFFMSEKGLAYRPHYNAIVNPNFRKMGVGLAWDKSAKKYYVTVHFGTDVQSELAACGNKRI